MAARACVVFVCGLGVQLGRASQSSFLADMEQAPTGEFQVVKDAVKDAAVAVQQKDNDPNILPPMEMWVMVLAGFLMAWACSIYCCCPTDRRALSQEEEDLAKGPSFFPRVLWRRGCCGWVGMLLTLPLFFIWFAFVNLLWLPAGTTVICSKRVRCQRVRLGHFINVGILAVDVALGIMCAHNPLCPHAVLANLGKWNMCLFGPILSVIGACANACRKRQAKQEGIEEDVPAADEDFVEIQVSDNVTTVQAKFSEGLESVCLMTVIQGEDWVMFYSPVFAPMSTYRKFCENKQRVILFLPTAYHHMAVDLVLAVYPKVEIWGSASAGTRHSPRLKVMNPADQSMGLPGFKHFDVSMTIYDEHWLYYEPAGLLLTGDFMPHIENAIDIPECPLWCFLSVGRCGKRWTMMNYQKSLVTDPTCIIDALRVIFKSKVNHMEGVHGRDHPGVEREPPLKELYDYWGWLLPADLDKEVSTELV